MPTTIRWSRAEIDTLFSGVGSYGIAWFERKLRDRSRAAVYAQLYRSYGAGGLTRGSWTLARAIDYSGYARSQLLRARKALGQKWSRTSGRGRYLITDDQLDECVAWLSHDYWVRRLRAYSCAWCGSRKYPHAKGGLCRPCYRRYHRCCYGARVTSSVRRQCACLEKLFAVDSQNGVLYRILQSLRRGVVTSPEDLPQLIGVLQNANETGTATRCSIQQNNNIVVAK